MTPRSKPLIYDLSQPALAEIVQSWGEPPYRTRQIWQGLYRDLWRQPGDFTTLPKPLRTRLWDSFSFRHLTPVTHLASKDGETQKTLFHLPDGKAIETVRMHYGPPARSRKQARNTLCVSTQSGCAMGCSFCATGQMGFQRNLSSGEIIEQILYTARQLNQEGEHLTNVVFMGMGEPFHNYDSVMEAIDRLNDPQGMNFGARRFTISTVGLVPGIRRFTAERRQVNLAISLHAAEDDLRSSLLPINRKYPLPELMAALREYANETRRRITFEWALIHGVNDSVEQAHKLARLLRGLLAHVNLIPLNPTQGFDGLATSRQQAEQFQSALMKRGIACSIRSRRGIDIQAGCGQLASR